VLARVRDGLRRLDAEPDGEDHASPRLADPAGTGRAPASAPPVLGAAPCLDAGYPAEPPALEAEACPPAPPPAAPSPPGDSAEPLSDSAIVSIRDTFRIVLAAGGEPASYFYGRLFASHPRLRAMFPPAMDEQRDRLLRALARIVDGLSSPEDLAEYLTQLGRDHRKYSVEPAMYDMVGEVLIATLRTFAGAAFTPGAEEAWRQAYQAASALMIRAAEDDSALAPAYWTAEVVANEQRQPGLAILTVAPDQFFSYHAGQHVTIQTPRWPRVWRPYSVANCPRDDGLMTFHVRAVPGGWVSNALVHYAEPGTELILGPALGTMSLSLAGRRDLLFVAGGTGLSPVKAIIEQALRESSACPRQIFLFYGARTRDGLYDLPELYRLADAYPRFQITPVTSDDPVFDGMQGNVGRVAARYLPHRDCEAYVAGPVAMVRETIRALTRAGMPRERIHYDDALLAEDKPANAREAPGETAKTSWKASTSQVGQVGNTEETAKTGPGATDQASEISPADQSDRTQNPRETGQAETKETEKASTNGTGNAATDIAQQDKSAPNVAIGSGGNGEPAAPEQGPAGVLTGRHHTSRD
jgi:NAD(P)H-flavin reductase/hemoglobin-like flavoprotein